MDIKDASGKIIVEEKNTEEYLRRNILIAKASGIRNNSKCAIVHLLTLKRQPKWLIEILKKTVEHAECIILELTKNRDQLKYKK